MANRYAALVDILTGGLGQHPARVRAFLDTLDDASAARLLAAAEAGDNRALLKAMSEQTWGTAPARPAPEVQVQPAGRSPMSFAERVANDPNIRRAVEDSGAQIAPGNIEGLLEAYRGAAPRRGRPKRAEDAIRELSRPADQVAAEDIAGQFDRAMIPYGTRGPAVPVGGPSAPGVPFNPSTDLIPAPPRRIGGQSRAIATTEPHGGLRPYRVVDEAAPRSSRDAMIAAATAAAGGAAYWAGQNLYDGSAVASGGEADLAEESRPAPKVEAADAEPTVKQGPQDYSLQARALINRLNDMRRAAGGEVPEAPAMMAEINRLIAMGNQQRQSPAYQYPPQDPAQDPYQQARNLIAQVNQMYQQGYSPNSPEVQRLMAQVRQLQSQGDAIRNRRAG